MTTSQSNKPKHQHSNQPDSGRDNSKVRVVGWMVTKNGEVVYIETAKPSRIWNNEKQRPLILAHDEADALEKLAYRAAQKEMSAFDLAKEIIDHAKELKELK